MSTDTASKLAEAFPAAMLRTVSKGGASLSYIPAPEVVHRLNEVLGPTGWSYEVLERWSAGERVTETGTFPTVCMAHVRLFVTIDGATAHKDGIGGQAVKFLTNGSAPIDLGDEWKGAVSDALKKAAQAYEVGLELARKEEAIAAEQAQQHAESEREQMDSQARDAGWADAAARRAEWERLKALTAGLPADEAATVRSQVVKAELKLQSKFTPENAKWWATLVDLATPKDRDVPSDNGPTGTGADVPQSSQPEMVPQ